MILSSKPKPVTKNNLQIPLLSLIATSSLILIMLTIIVTSSLILLILTMLTMLAMLTMLTITLFLINRSYKIKESLIFVVQSLAKGVNWTKEKGKRKLNNIAISIKQI